MTNDELNHLTDTAQAMVSELLTLYLGEDGNFYALTGDQCSLVPRSEVLELLGTARRRAISLHETLSGMPRRRVRPKATAE